MIMFAVSSSNLARVGYDDATQTLRVEFKSGGVYDYPNTPKMLYNGLMSASSKGEYHAAYIKNRPYRRIG